MAAKLHKFARRSERRERGFTILEVVAALAISSIVAAVAIPGYLAMMRYLRIAGDSRDINASVALAKMRAAQDYTHARVYADLSANAFMVEVWDKKGTGGTGTGCWRAEGDAQMGSATPCTPPTSLTSLSQDVTFGTNGAPMGFPNPQTTIAQAPTCMQGVAGGTLGTSYANTACIEFNSRGVPVGTDNFPLPAPVGLYVTDQQSVYGVTVIQTGLIQVWCMYPSTTQWKAR